jgi:hypothetical protein
VRFDRGGEKLGDCGTRGGDDDSGAAGEFGAAEGEEGGGALVDE